MNSIRLALFSSVLADLGRVEQFLRNKDTREACDVPCEYFAELFSDLDDEIKALIFDCYVLFTLSGLISAFSRANSHFITSLMAQRFSILFFHFSSSCGLPFLFLPERSSFSGNFVFPFSIHAAKIAV